MNYSTLPVVPGVRNRHLWTASEYKGLPVMANIGPFIAEQLETVYQGLSIAKQAHPRLYALRFDLRFPRLKEGELDALLYTNDFIRDFKIKLKYLIDCNRQQAAKLCERAHDTEFHFIWVREYGVKSKMPHIHFCLLLNGHAFYRRGQYELDCDNLYSRIVIAWATALELPAEEVQTLVSFSKNGEFMVRSDQDFAELFHRLSYFAKLKTKRFDDGLHCMQRSRAKPPNSLAIRVL